MVGWAGFTDAFMRSWMGLGQGNGRAALSNRLCHFGSLGGRARILVCAENMVASGDWPRSLPAGTRTDMSLNVLRRTLVTNMMGQFSPSTVIPTGGDLSDLMIDLMIDLILC